MKTYQNLKLQTAIREARENHTKVSRGFNLLASAYINTVRDKHETLVVSDLGFENDCREFLEQLDQYQINGFILTESSTMLLEALAIIMEGGWKVEAPIRWTEGDDFFHQERTGLVIVRQ